MTKASFHAWRRYDGYNAALASASADIASAEASLRQGPAAAAASALQAGSSSADSAARRQQLRMGVRGLQRLVADTWTAGRRAMANGALSPERAVSPPRSEGLGSARGSSPVPASPLSDDEEGGVMSDDALQRPRGSKCAPALLPGLPLLCANAVHQYLSEGL
jgi:hypothetical protein